MFFKILHDFNDFFIYEFLFDSIHANLDGFILYKKLTLIYLFNFNIK